MQYKKLSKAAVIAITIVAIALTATTAAVLTINQNVSLNGSITAVNLGVYSDSACTQTCTPRNVGTVNQAAPAHKQSTSKTQATSPKL